ncbi:MAG: hypothetical protein IJH07_01180 [Ruminococcus sp.]|nr:hypothetical protein [Ruminococcus sp.]
MKIGIFGGDKRMLFAARAFAEDGHEVYVAGFDDLKSLCEIRVCDFEEAAADCDVAVLPVRPVIGNELNAPFAKQKPGITELMEKIGTKPVFTGDKRSILPDALGEVYDYAAQEDFLLKNAELTAEGAVGLLISDYEGAIRDTEILVTGYGRIGKALCAYLGAMGAKVTAAVRKQSDRMSAMEHGYPAVDYPEIDFGRFRVICNTVPAPVLGVDAVDLMREDVFIVDLASAPGGVDRARAEERGLTCVHALSLPGKTAPLTAGMIIKDTIINILSRNN